MFKKTNYSFFVLAYYDTPQILAESEYIVEAYQNHSLFCQGKSPLHWTVPEVKVSALFTVIMFGDFSRFLLSKYGFFGGMVCFVSSDQ